jgi:hypothetical protein
MRRLGPLLALGAALLGGCSTTHQQARPATVEELQSLMARDAVPREPRRADRDPVTLLHQHGGERPSVTLPPPAMAGARPGREDVPLVDLSELRGYEVKRRLPGALEGLMWGFVAGAAAGAIAGAAQGDDPPGQFIQFTAGEKAAVGGVILGATGGALGALIGGLLGHTDRYLF